MVRVLSAIDLWSLCYAKLPYFMLARQVSCGAGIIGKTKSAILKNEKYIFLVFSDLFGRGCLTAVQSPLKRYLIG